MDFFNFVWNCIVSFFELLDNVPIMGNFSALDFILGILLVFIFIKLVFGNRSD